MTSADAPIHADVRCCVPGTHARDNRCACHLRFNNCVALAPIMHWDIADIMAYIPAGLILPDTLAMIFCRPMPGR